MHELSKLKYVAFRRDLESDRKILWLVVAREKRTELTALVLNLSPGAENDDNTNWALGGSRMCWGKH